MDKQLYLRFALRCLCILGAVLLLCYALPLCYGLASPFFFATWMASLLNPWIATLEERFRWKRQFLVLWILLFCTLIVGSLLVLLLPVLWRELRELGQQWDGLLEQISSFPLWTYFSSGENSSSAMTAVKNWLSSQVAVALQGISQWLFALPSFLLRFVVFLLATYFIACDFPHYGRLLKSHCSGHWMHWASLLKHSATTAFAGYLKAQLLLSAGVFLIMVGGFLWMSLPFALLLALGIAVLDFIPMIGSGMILLPWAVVVWLLGDTAMPWQLGGIWLATAVFRQVLEPKVLGQQTGLSPLLSLGSIYLGLELWGLWGMIFAPVLFLVVMNFFALGIFRGTVADGKALLAHVHTVFSTEQEE